MRSIMTLLYFSKTSDIGPSSRYRIFQYLPYLESYGIQVSVKPLFGPAYFHILRWKAAGLRNFAKVIYVSGRFVVRLLQVVFFKHRDLVVIEGQLFPYMGVSVERLLRRRHKLVIELDDAIYLTRGHEKTIPEVLTASSGAIVGNKALEMYVSSYTSHVYVIPTVVDTGRFTPLATPRDEHEKLIVIGWIGLDFNAPYLEWLAPVFQKLHTMHPVIVRTICARPPKLSGVPIDFKRWEYSTEIEHLQSCHIGVMPLPETEWAKCKCGLKLLQYMAVGLPSVASPVGVNQDIVTDGVNGFLARTHDEWFAKLSQLCEDADSRARLGQEARKTVVTRYSLTEWAPRLAHCYQSFVKRPQPSAATVSYEAGRNEPKTTRSTLG